MPRSADTIRVDLAPPRVVFLLAAAILLTSTAVALNAPLAAPLRWAGALAVLAVGGAVLTRWAVARPRTVSISDSGVVRLIDSRGVRESANLAGAPRVLSLWLSVPLDRRTGIGGSLLITPDMTDAASYARLARRLRTMTRV